jgi:hypothetical protein
VIPRDMVEKTSLPVLEPPVFMGFRALTLVLDVFDAIWPISTAKPKLIQFLDYEKRCDRSR